MGTILSPTRREKQPRPDLYSGANKGRGPGRGPGATLDPRLKPEGRLLAGILSQGHRRALPNGPSVQPRTEQMSKHIGGPGARFLTIREGARRDPTDRSELRSRWNGARKVHGGRASLLPAPKWAGASGTGLAGPHVLPCGWAAWSPPGHCRGDLSCKEAAEGGRGLGDPEPQDREGQHSPAQV